MKKVPILLSISTRRARLAVGRSAPGGRFIVYAGSRAAASVVPSTRQAIIDLRNALIAAQVLVPAKDGTDSLVFAQDFVFSASSTAASVVMGLSASGNEEWRPML
jgi:hypothetical protein